MGPVNAVYSWGSVKALYATVFSMNLAGIAAAALAIVWAVRFERGFGDYLNLVAPGDGHVWTAVIISATVLCTPAYILGIKSCLYLKEESSKMDLEEEPNRLDPREAANRLLFFHVIACLLSGFLVAVLNATYLALLSGFHQKSRDGLMQAIQRYGSDVAVKERVDAVQTELECCGDNGYEDWFRVSWLKLSIEGPEDAENGPRLEEQSVPEDREEELSTADVPFSCCSNDVPKPCVHHDILNPSAAYDYDPKHLTISTLGCRSKIIDRSETIRTFLSGYLALLSAYQVVLSFLSRLLQTAHSDELYIGPKKTLYQLWIFFSPETTLTNRKPLIKRKSSEHSQLRKRSSRRLPSCSSSGSSDERDEINPLSHKVKNSGVRVLNEIRSKISSAKSKSLPIIKSSASIAKKIRVSRKDSSTSEGTWLGKEEKKRVSGHVTKSEVVVKKDYDSVGFSANDSSIADDLPPPPPPPPLTATFEKDTSSVKREALVQKEFIQRITANQNSGRRIKVLERFGRIEGWQDRGTQHRESGGADCSERTSSSSRSKKLGRVKFNPSDFYDRFRGSLQHTLARREAIQTQRGSGRNYVKKLSTNLDTRRSSLLERLGCKNVPPSYRLLANLEDRRRPTSQMNTAPTPPPLPSPWSRNTVHRQRQCSICHRPVQRSPDSSGCSSLDEDPLKPWRERQRSRIYVPRNRSTTASRSVNQR